MHNPRFTGIHSSPKETQLQECCVSFGKECRIGIFKNKLTYMYIEYRRKRRKAATSTSCTESTMWLFTCLKAFKICNKFYPVNFIMKCAKGSTINHQGGMVKNAKKNNKLFGPSAEKKIIQHCTLVTDCMNQTSFFKPQDSFIYPVLDCGILWHMSYTCLADFVHPRKLQRSGGTYFLSFTLSVSKKAEPKSGSEIMWSPHRFFSPPCHN